MPGAAVRAATGQSMSPNNTSPTLVGEQNPAGDGGGFVCVQHRGQHHVRPELASGPLRPVYRSLPKP
jgi:hypothetical protein